MTLLVLDLHTPMISSIHSERDLLHALISRSPQILMFAMSFLTLGILWIRQQAQLNYFARCDRRLTWINITFLLGITMVPFSTSLLAEFIAYRIAFIVYWINLLFLGILLYASWHYAVKAGLVRDDIPPRAGIIIKRNIMISQALYGFSALLCVINPYWSIGLIVLVQLNYAVAPKFLEPRR
jgi:uncharacterized membrane protein